MSKKKKKQSSTTLAIRGVFFNWAGRVCSFAITFFLTPYLIHELGDARYGLWAILLSLTNYYTLADAGMRSAGTKYIAQYDATGDHESINKVIVSSLSIYGFMAFFVVLATIPVAFVFPMVFDIAGENVTHIRYAVVLTGITVAFRLMAQVFSATLNAIQRYDILNMMAVSVQVSQAVGMVVVVASGGGLLGMAAVSCALAFVGQLTRTMVARRMMPHIKLSWKYWDRQTLKTVFRFGGVSLLTGMARRTTERFGSLLIGFLLGPAAVAYYFVAESLSVKAMRVGRGITTVIDPLASRLNAKGNMNALRELALLGPRLLTAISLALAVIFVVMGRVFIDVWIGPEYTPKVYPALCVITAAMVARMSSNPLRSIFRGIADLRVLVTTALIELAVVLVMGPVLVISFGVIGMACSLLAAEAVVGLVVLPRRASRLLGISLYQYFRGVFLRPAIAVLPSLPVAIMFVEFFHASRMRYLAPQMLVVFFVAAVSIFLLCIDANRREDILRAYLPKRRKKEPLPAQPQAERAESLMPQ